MKLLFENWRKFLKESANDVSGVIQAEEELIVQLLSTSKTFELHWNGGVDPETGEEILGMKNSLEGTAHHHGETSAQHTLNVVDAMDDIIDEYKDELDDAAQKKYKLLAALHDIGKGITRGVDPETEKVSFRGHASRGAELAEKILDEYEDLNESDRITMKKLVKMHMQVLFMINKIAAGEKIKPKPLERFATKAGDEMETLLRFTKANLKALIDPADAPNVSGREWESFKGGVEASIKEVDQLKLDIQQALKTITKAKEVDTAKRQAGPVDFAKDRAAAGLESPQIRGIISNRWPNKDVNQIMKDAGLE